MKMSLSAAAKVQLAKVTMKTGYALKVDAKLHHSWKGDKMKYALVQAEQVHDDVVVEVAGVPMLVDPYIAEQAYAQLEIGYLETKGFVIAADNETYYSKKVVIRRPKPVVETAISCQTPD